MTPAAAPRLSTPHGCHMQAPRHNQDTLATSAITDKTKTHTHRGAHQQCTGLATSRTTMGVHTMSGNMCTWKPRWKKAVAVRTPNRMELMDPRARWSQPMTTPLALPASPNAASMCAAKPCSSTHHTHPHTDTEATQRKRFLVGLCAQDKRVGGGGQGLGRPQDGRPKRHLFENPGGGLVN
jgi:hypothetical protein